MWVEGIRKLQSEGASLAPSSAEITLGICPPTEREDGEDEDLSKKGLKPLQRLFFRYMSEVVCLQRPVGTEWIYEKMPPSPPPCPPEHCSPGPPVLQHQPQAQPQLQPQPPLQKGPSGSGEAVIVLQEVRNQEVAMSPGGGTGLNLEHSELGADC